MSDFYDREPPVVFLDETAALDNAERFDCLIREALAKRDAAPRWKRALWTIRAWVWPFRWCPFFHAVVCELPVAHIAHHRTAWLTTFHPWSPRLRWMVVGFRVGRPIHWRQVWSRDDEVDG